MNAAGFDPRVRVLEARVARLESLLRSALRLPMQRGALDGLVGQAVDNAILVASVKGTGPPTFAWKPLTGATGMAFAQSALAMTGTAVPAEIDHTELLNIGSNPHATIDTHVASTANPHSVTAAQAGAAEDDHDHDADYADIDHDASHVGAGGDKIRDATAAQDGLMTAAYATKVDGIEAAADVTDADNVNAAGAVMHGDIASNGIVARTAAETYTPRAMTASGGVAVTNGDGVAGAPNHTLNINGLAADGSPNAAADYVATYDADAGVHKKVLLENIGGGGGDVVGPGSSTDNAIARFHLATGKIIQNSGVLVDDDNNVTLPGSILDSNGNELVDFGPVESAVNQIKISNAIADDAPTIEAEGATNVPLHIKSKGSGIVVIGLAGDISLGDTSLRRMRPMTNEKIDLGTTSYRFNEVHFVKLVPKNTAAWTITNGQTDREFDADTVTVAELADAFYTLLVELGLTT